MTGHFLQSKEWEEFQRSLGREVFRVEGQLVVKSPLAFGKSYLYSGGVTNFQFSNNFQNSNFQTLAKEHNAVFLKFEPMTEDMILGKELTRAVFVKSKKEIQPQKTIILDITKPEEKLLKEMSQKTRYNIRVAERNGVKFSIFPPTGDLPQGDNFQFSNNFQSSNFEILESFWELLKKTAQRDKFSAHTKEYYEKLLELPIIELSAAVYQDKIIAGNIILLYGDRVTYLHGAADYEYRNLMAPYLSHWETIKYAKERGYKKYDLWGADEKKWPGVTRFKKGFGGRKIEYIGSYDYAFNPFFYKLYNLRSFIKRIF